MKTLEQRIMALITADQTIDDVFEAAGITSISEDRMEDLYVEMLDDVYAPIKIGVLHYEPSAVLRAVDPTAFRCGLVDFSAEYAEIVHDGEIYYFTADDFETLENWLDEKEQEAGK